MHLKIRIKSIQKLPRLTSDNNTRANKTFLYKITTNLSTLRCYNFNVDNDEAENSTFIISIEEKLPHDTFLKWEDYKSELKSKKEIVTLGKTEPSVQPPGHAGPNS